MNIRHTGSIIYVRDISAHWRQTSVQGFRPGNNVLKGGKQFPDEYFQSAKHEIRANL